MGLKYATVLSGGVVSTYNDNGPADDGSQTATNRVKFATIKSDLTTPLHSAITKIDSRITDHFDEGPDVHSASYTTVASDFAKVLEAAGASTITLLAPSGQAGYRCTIKNVSTASDVTVAVTGGALVDGQTTITLSALDALEVMVNNAEDAYHILRYYDSA